MAWLLLRVLARPTAVLIEFGSLTMGGLLG